VGIAYETVTDTEGKLPLLTPMSEIAGRISIQAGATALQIANGGKGVLLGGVAGVYPGKVVVIGGGAVGTEAVRMAMGLGADVTVFDTNLNRLHALDALYGPRLKTHYSTPTALEDILHQVDLIIGAVLIPGKLAPRLIKKEHLQRMEPGTVIVDVAIDQGGCVETSRPTSHSEPTFVVDGIVHYCVTNMPGACARTATEALTNATHDYIIRLANKGYKQAMKEDAGLKNGLNVYFGNVTHPDVAHDLGLECISPTF
jgi:alanine dehydrogenase